MFDYMKPLAVTALFFAPTALHAEESNWTGFYLGANVGTKIVDDTAIDDADVTYGVHAGYDHDFGQFVLGAQLEYSSADFHFSNGGSLDTETLRIKGRLGYDHGKTLTYLVLGHAKLKASGPGGSTDFSGTTVGFGAAYRLTNNVELGLEYLNDSMDRNVDADELTARISYRF